MASPGIAREGYEISFDHRMLDGVSEANHPFGDSGRIKKLATRLAAEMAPTASLGIKSEGPSHVESSVNGGEKTQHGHK